MIRKERAHDWGLLPHEQSNALPVFSDCLADKTSFIDLKCCSQTAQHCMTPLRSLCASVRLADEATQAKKKSAWKIRFGYAMDGWLLSGAQAILKNLVSSAHSKSPTCRQSGTTLVFKFWHHSRDMTWDTAIKSFFKIFFMNIWATAVFFLKTHLYMSEKYLTCSGS